MVRTKKSPKILLIFVSCDRKCQFNNTTKQSAFRSHECSFLSFSVFVKCPVLMLVSNIAFDDSDNDNGLGRIRARWKHLELFTDERRLITSCNVRQRCDSVCAVARPPDRPLARSTAPLALAPHTCQRKMSEWCIRTAYGDNRKHAYNDRTRNSAYR